MAGGKGSHFSFSKEGGNLSIPRSNSVSESEHLGIAKKISRQGNLETRGFIYVYSIRERERERLLDHSSFIDFSSRDKSLIEEERRRRERKKVASIRVERIVRK